MVAFGRPQRADFNTFNAIISLDNYSSNNNHNNNNNKPLMMVDNAWWWWRHCSLLCRVSASTGCRRSLGHAEQTQRAVPLTIAWRGFAATLFLRAALSTAAWLLAGGRWLATAIGRASCLCKDLLKSYLGAFTLLAAARSWCGCCGWRCCWL